MLSSLIFLLVFMNLAFHIQCLNVKFSENYDANINEFDTHIFKRELTQFFDKSSYSFDGLTKVESVPVLFPLDICILNLEGVKYATALHKHRNGTRHLAVYRYEASSYQTLLDLPTPLAIALDCTTHVGRGYIALAYNLTETVERAREGSPIYEISPTEGVRAVQYFATINLRAMYLRVSGNELTLLQTFHSSQVTDNLNCPFFRWSGTSFNRVGRIPCSNARRLEPFTIDYEHYVAVANYADESGRTVVDSEIYKFNAEHQKFQLFQRIRTNGAVDVKYFSVPQDEVRRNHFLIFGNSFGKHDGSSNIMVSANMQADSVFYVYDKGQFVPYQRLSFYAIERFLPVQNDDPEKFLLLVACNKQDIKIYNLNDWKFEESKVQFTEGALSRGVSRMRTYEEHGKTYLVIANELMTDNETNIFLPIYKQDEHANALRQQIIEWAARENERLASINIEDLKQAVEKKLAKMTPQPATNEEQLKLQNVHIKHVETKSFVSAHLNLDSNYWEALGYAKRALDVMERKLSAKDQTTSRKSRSTTKQQVTLDQHQFEEINVETLIVRDNLQAQRINGVDTKNPSTTFDKVTAAKIYVEGSYVSPKTTSSNPDSEENESNDEEMVSASPNGEAILNVEHFEISGKLNGHSWEELVNDTLKRKGLQFIKSPATISNIEAEAVVVTDNIVNGLNLAQLITTTGGDYIVQQDVQFADPIRAKQLMINDRLNNIHVFKGQFDVLLKKANWTQIMEGPIRFENIKVLEPITLAGHIQGDELRSMAPTKSIHQNLELQGDYTINGDVSVSKFLSAFDILDEPRNLSLKETLNNGINMTEPLENVNLNFMQPLKINHTQLSFVNAQDLQELVKLNNDEVQIVEGHKSWTDDLTVSHGFSEVKLLNDINVEQLENKLLQKHNNQTILMSMHVGKVIAKGVQAQNITLNNHNLSDYLMHTGNQHINGTLYITELHADSLDVEYLNTDSDLYGHKLSDIYNQKSKSSPNTKMLFQPDQKFHGSIYVQNLWFNGTLNNATVEDLERELRQMDGNVKYVGDFEFRQEEMRFPNLSFSQSFNGIRSVDFGRSWLQREGEQHFTVPQTLASVECKQNLKLMGKLNGQTLEHYEKDTYRIDRNENLEAVIFENSINLDGKLYSPQVNGLRIPDDMLLRYNVTPRSMKPQTLHADALLVVRGDLNALGSGVCNTSHLNTLNLRSLGRYLNGTGYDTLHVEHAAFEQAPNYKTLNRHNLKWTLDHVWLANENVELQSAMPEQQRQRRIELEEAHFEGLLDFEGNINNVDLEYLKHNYFSLKRAQQITTALHFCNDVTHTQQPLQAAELQLRGALVETQSNYSFDFNNFVKNTLKTSGPHYISGQWSMLEAIIPGDLQNVRINDLNLAQDVLLRSPFENATNRIPNLPLKIIHGEKRVSSVGIKKLYAMDKSSIDNVPVARWINETVYIYENHTILGVTELETLNLYNNLRVDGLVNGIRFDSKNLMLRDREQLLPGEFVVRNSMPEVKSILTHNIEQLSVERINDLPVRDLLAYHARNQPNLHIDGQLIFTQPLVVGNYEEIVGEDVLALGRMKRDDNYEENDVPDGNVTMSTESSLLAQAMELKDLISAPPNYKLSHFELRQYLPLNVSHIIPITLRLSDELLDIIGIIQQGPMDYDVNTVEYYVWQRDQGIFVPNATLNWMPQGRVQLEILRLITEHDNHQQQPPTINNEMPGFIMALKRLQHEKAKLALPIQLGNEICFGIYGEQSAKIGIYCIDKVQGLRIYEAAEIDRAGVKQVLVIGLDMLALICNDNSVELWKGAKDGFELMQTLSIPRPLHLASVEHAGRHYLAVVSGGRKQGSLIEDTIEIYRTELLNETVTAYQKYQIIDDIGGGSVALQQVALVAIAPADELVMYLLTETQPLIVYQYRGVMGFQQIVGATMLPNRAWEFQTFKLKSDGDKELIAFKANESVFFVESTLQTF